VLGVEAEHGDGAVLSHFPRLAGMEIKEAVFFGKYEDQVGFVVCEVFEDAFFDLGFADIMEFGV
jgi:hypothetical protein